MKGTLWITGVAGFSGRHLAHYIASRVSRPRVVGIDVCDAPSLPLDAYHRLDLCDAVAVAAAARGRRPTWVIHLAGVPPAASAGDLWRGHVGATLGLATGLVRAGCRQTRLLSIGSAAEYPPANRVISERFGPGPSTEYGRSKLGQTLLTIGLPRTLGLRACVARTFNLVGPGLPTRFVLGRLCAEFTRVGPRGSITLQHLETSRDFIDVRDAVDAYWRLVRRGRSGDIYNVCSGVAVSLTELIEHLSAATGKRPVIRTTHTHDRARDPDITYGSFAKLARATGWTPQIDLPSSIRAMLADAGDAEAASSATRRRASGATTR